GTGIHGQAAGVQSGEEVSTEIFDPRRATRGVGKFLDVSLERGIVRGAIFVTVGRARLCRAEIRNIAWRLDGVSPYQSKLASREWCHGRLRRRHDQFPRLDRLRARVYRLDQRRFGPETACRSDAGPRLRAEDLAVQ